MEFIPNYSKRTVPKTETPSVDKFVSPTFETNMDKDTIGVYIWPWCWVSEQVDFQVP